MLLLHDSRLFIGTVGSKTPDDRFSLFRLPGVRVFKSETKSLVLCPIILCVRTLLPLFLICNRVLPVLS